MEHIEWLDPERVNVIRISLKIDTFLDDIKNKKCQQLRIIKEGDFHYVRYKLGRKIYWYKVGIHSFVDYLMTPTEITGKEKEKLNRKYLSFNRDWAISSILN